MRRMNKTIKYFAIAVVVLLFCSASKYNVKATSEIQQIEQPIGKNESPVEQEIQTDTEQTESDPTVKNKSGQTYLNAPLDNPIPVLYKYEIEGDGNITPGEEFTIKFTVYNPAVVSDAGNIQVYLYQTDNLIYPVYGGSNSVYLGYANTLSYVEGELTMMASKDITDEELMVNMSLYYTDNYRTENVQQLVLALPVSTGGKLSLSRVDIPSSMYVGSNNRINVSYRNNGLSAINDVVLHLSGDGMESKDISLGSIGSSTSMTSDAYVDFDSEGEHTVDMFFSYTDKDGQTLQTDVVTYTFKVNAYEEADITDNTIGMIRRNKINSFISLFFLIVSIGIVIFYFFSGRNKRIRRKQK
ncbi:hypothetical protein [Butyrivibrio sp. JL13D10]|uniref:hypothetical protein n=1 Tax=Butyrivibrio sp. JL13D10 TaxID=3236815 RepID=UPI0038B4E9AD